MITVKGYPFQSGKKEIEASGKYGNNDEMKSQDEKKTILSKSQQRNQTSH